MQPGVKGYIFHKAKLTLHIGLHHAVGFIGINKVYKVRIAIAVGIFLLLAAGKFGLKAKLLQHKPCAQRKTVAELGIINR